MTIGNLGGVGRLGLTRGTGVPVRAWRFAAGNPVRRATGGYWLRA